MTLTVRSATVTGAVTKGSALTHAEMDANWAHVIDSSNQTFVQSGTGTVTDTVQNAIRHQPLNIFNFIPTSLHTAVKANTNTADLSTYIQAAIDEMDDSKRPLDLSGYILTIESQLVFRTMRNFQIFGRGGQGTQTVTGCAIKWNGANSGTPVLIDQCRDYLFGGVAIIPGNGTISVGLEIDAVGAVTVTPTNGKFSDLFIGTSDTAIRISNTAAANNDFHKFYDVYIGGTGTYGYHIADQQAKCHKIYNGSIGGRTTAGIYCEAGSFVGYSPNFDNNGADILLGTPTDTILLLNPTGEGSNRFIDQPSNSATGWAVTVVGGRIAHNDLHADGKFIRYHNAGPLNLMGVDFASGTYNASWKCELHASNAGAVANITGCIFPNRFPFHYATTSDAHTVYQQGNLGLSSGSGSSFPLAISGIETSGGGGAGGGNLGRRLELFDDFLGDTLDADRWNTRVGSDPQCVAAAILADQAAGVINLTAGNDAAADHATNGTQLESGLNWRVDRQQLVFEIRFRLDVSVAAYALFFGFTDQNSALEMPFTLGAGDALTSNATNAFGVLHDSAADTDQWCGVGVKADVDATKQFFGVANVANNWEHWRLEYVSGDGLYFYRNGALVGSKMSNAVTESTLLTPVVALFSRTTATRTMQIDYINVQSAR